MSGSPKLPAKKEAEEVPMILHRVPVLEHVEGVGAVSGFKEVLIPLTDNDEYDANPAEYIEKHGL